MIFELNRHTSLAKLIQASHAVSANSSTSVDSSAGSSDMWIISAFRRNLEPERTECGSEWGQTMHPPSREQGNSGDSGPQGNLDAYHPQFILNSSMVFELIQSLNQQYRIWTSPVSGCAALVFAQWGDNSDSEAIYNSYTTAYISKGCGWAKLDPL